MLSEQSRHERTAGEGPEPTRNALWKLSAMEQAALVQSGEVSPVALVESALARLDDVDPLIHAFTARDHDGALSEARRQEQALISGHDVGPMAGVPVAVKDLISARGLPMTGGSAAYEKFVPDEDDVVVERLRAAGAIVLGKTNVSEMGYTALSHNPLHSTTRNPWNLAVTPGGSSAGSAAAVAAGICSFALGSDGGGSVRAPAAHCGLVGFKPSMGRVPLYPGCRDERYPGFSSWESLEHIGPIARSVEDAAFMLSVIAGPDPRDRHSIPCDDLDWMTASRSRPGRPRIAYSPDFGYAAVDPQVRDIVERAVSVLADAVDADLEVRSPDWVNPGDAFLGIVALDTDLKGMRKLADVHRDEMSPEVLRILDHPWTAEDLTNAVVGRKAFVNSMWRFMNNFDFIITPALTVPPFPVETPGPVQVDGKAVSPFAWTSFLLPFNLTGQPAIAVPAGWTSDGLPVGLQIAGKHLGDQSVLGLAAVYQAVNDWRHRWPLPVGGAATDAYA